jgi:Ca2+/Na+ antiporter
MTILHLILPINLFPEFAFLAIVLIFFALMDFILTVFSILSIHTSLSHILIALTIISWGSSPVELINLVIASRNNELQLGLTSILSALVIAFCVLLPSAMIYKMLRRNTHQIQVLQPIHSSNLFFLPAIAVTLVSMLIYLKTKMQLGRKSASTLILTYIAYIGFMTWMLASDTS